MTRSGTGSVVRAVAAAVGLLATAAPIPAEELASPRIPEDVASEDLMEDEFSPIAMFNRVRHLRPRIRLAQQGRFGQDFSGVDIDTHTTQLLGKVVAPVSKRLALRLVGRGEASFYDFHGSERFLNTGRSAGDPFDELFSTQLHLEGRYQISGHWAVAGGATYSSQWESGAAYGSGIQGGGFAGAGYIFDHRFSIVAGMAVRSRLGRGGVSWSPLVKIGWMIAENLELASEGTGARLAYRPAETLTLFLRGGLDSEQYRLANRDAGIGKGTLRDRSAPVVVGWNWDFHPRWRLRGRLGAVVYQQWRVARKDGDEVDTETSRRPAFTGQLSLEYRF